MTPERQWQQTTGLFFKAADSLKKLMAALQAENISSFPAKPNLPDISRFDYFRKGDRVSGVWLYRNKNGMRFTLPFTTGTRPGMDDYLPAPHGLPGFAAPVEQLLPVLTPYLELEDGQTVAACDGADEIAMENYGVRARWKRWSAINPEKADADLPFGQPEKYVDSGLSTEVAWMITKGGDLLMRSETITASWPVTIRRLRLTFPSTADQVVTKIENGHRTDRFIGKEGTLEFSASMQNIPLTETSHTNTNIRFTESSRGIDIPLLVTFQTNSATLKGTRGPIPLILTLEATNIVMKPIARIHLDISLRQVPGK